MTDATLVFSSLAARWLNSLLSVLLTACGVMLALLVIQFGHHVHNRLGTDGAGIDIVVGAKGSPLQLVLSSVYHIDVPAGNIAYDAAKRWMAHPQVKTAIPLALGDNWHGWRIVGTTDAYLHHYRATLAQGRVWQAPFEAVAGAATGLATGMSFAGAHGLEAGGHMHTEHRYHIVGVLKPTGTVLDRLIVTSLDSVLALHGQDSVEDTQSQSPEHEPEHDHHPAPPEITALLLTTTSPLATVNLPRSINRDGALQAATPALEIARLSTLLGAGSGGFTALSALLIAIAALSIFAGLAGSLDSRRNDLAVLRALGYSRARLFRLVAAEGMALAATGLALGLGLGLAIFALMARSIAPLAASGATASLPLQAWLVVPAVLLAGLAASFLPALRAARVDAAHQLSLTA